MFILEISFDNLGYPETTYMFGFNLCDRRMKKFYDGLNVV